MCRDRERQAHIHPAAVALHGRVEKLLDLGKRHDLVELPSDLLPGHSEDGAVQIDVLATGQLWVETSPTSSRLATRPRIAPVLASAL